MDLNRERVLAHELERRNAQYEEYQINIDNFRAAIAEIERNHLGDNDLLQFRQELLERLAEEQRQQKRTLILRDVIRQQLTMPAPPN